MSTDNPVTEIIRWPTVLDEYDGSDPAMSLAQIIRELSDADLKQAAMAAFQRNVWSPLAKGVLLEVWRRWSAMVTLAAAPKPGEAFGLYRDRAPVSPREEGTQP